MEILIDEAQNEYWNTMNSIILKKHLSESINELVPTELSVSLSKSKKLPPYNGLLEINKGKDIIIEEGERSLVPSKSFVNVFEEYCSKTILNEKAVVIAMRQIRTECEKIGELELCKTVRDRKEPSRFEQFQTEQISFLQRSFNRLRSAWVTSVK
jgi:Zn finger protein HypA/HybF involved in hydrogenase expression